MAKRNKKLVVNKAPQVLPNPNAFRLPVVEACNGCKKVFEETNVCMVYEDPAAITRRGCAFNYKMSEAEAKKINPLKASKKKSRRR